MPKLSILDQVRVASPCPASWAQMRGDDRARFCDHCQRNVYNLSEMTRAEAEQLILSKEGRLCVRYYQRTDGTILTQDCPVGLRRARRYLLHLLSAVAAGFAFLAASLGALTKGTGGGSLRLRDFEPFARLANWINPPKLVPMGSLAPTPAQMREIKQLKLQALEAAKAGEPLENYDETVPAEKESD